MNCEFSDKLSRLFDRELSPPEAERVREHLNSCPVCTQLEQDFLKLRHQIKSYESDTDLIFQRQTLWKVLASQSVPIWRRKIALPAPVLALVVIALLALGAWSVFVLTSSPRTPDLDKRVLNILPEVTTDAGVPDLSRFDRGERAILYKERRSDLGVTGGKGAGR